MPTQGPLTRAELARALGVIKRTASQIALALGQAGLIAPPAPEPALQPVLTAPLSALRTAR